MKKGIAIVALISAIALLGLTAMTFSSVRSSEPKAVKLSLKHIIDNPNFNLCKITHAIVVEKYPKVNGATRIAVCDQSDFDKIAILIVDNDSLAKQIQPQTVLSFDGYIEGDIQAQLDEVALDLKAFRVCDVWQTETLNQDSTNTNFMPNLLAMSDWDSPLLPAFWY